ncbi:dipeptidase [Pacificimonas sp. ICDLI1SI03]
MFRPVAASLSLVLGMAAMAAPATAQDENARIDAILSEQPVFDGHNDLPGKIRELNDQRVSDFPYARLTERFKADVATDAEMMKAGHVGAQFWSVYVPASLPEPEAVVQTLEQIDLTDRLIAANPDSMAKALTAEDVRRIMASGRVAGMYGVEGGHSIANSLAVLRQFYDLGARYMTLTHGESLAWADSATDLPKSNGLSQFGREVVREMNRLGMLVDLSHVSAAAMNDALDESQAPVIFSHSSARAVTDHVRNVPDEVLQRLPENGGVIMVTFVEGFVKDAFNQWWAQEAAEKARLEFLHPDQPELVDRGMQAWRNANPAPKATISDVADHIDHIKQVAGIDAIGLGGDFDGVPSYAIGMETVAAYPDLFAELLRRGYSEEELKKISSGNILRALEQAEAVAARLQTERGPSEVLFTESE